MPPETPLTPTIVYAVVLGLGVVIVLLLLAAVLALRGGQRARLRARAAEVARGGRETNGVRGAGLKGNRLTQDRVKELGAAQSEKRQIIRTLIEQAGLTWSVGHFYVVSVVCAAAAVVVYLVAGMPFWAALAAPIAGGLLLPRWYLRRLAGSRQKKFTAQLADGIDIIVRGIRSGLPVGECLAIIGRESPEPIAGEFRQIVEGQRLGLTLKEIMDKAAVRMPTADMRFFGVVLVLQQKTGGNLAEALANLSGILRARRRMAEKIRAMSSEARMTATIIGSLPFLVGGLMYLLNPDYIGVLFLDPMGRAMAVGGLMWMSIGMFVMKQLVSFKI